MKVTTLQSPKCSTKLYILMSFLTQFLLLKILITSLFLDKNTTYLTRSTLNICLKFSHHPAVTKLLFLYPFIECVMTLFHMLLQIYSAMFVHCMGGSLASGTHLGSANMECWQENRRKQEESSKHLSPCPFAVMSLCHLHENKNIFLIKLKILESQSSFPLFLQVKGDNTLVFSLHPTCNFINHFLLNS